MKQLLNILKIISPFLLGIGILWWMYRNLDWKSAFSMLHNTHWQWMLLSLLFGIVPLVLRALRWQIALKPLEERPSARICIDAIFISYAASLVIPRVGEITRCGTLKNYAGTSFSKALGTVVAERVVDAFLMLLIAIIALCLQLPQFLNFLRSTGTSTSDIFMRFTSTGYMITLICAIVGTGFGIFLLTKIPFFQKGKDKMKSFFDGLSSLLHLQQLPLYLLYSIGIWVGYFLHFYLAFFAYDCTSHLDLLAGLLIFSAGTFAVLVPTPNGAGPWHFAVKTMLVLYGVAQAPAILFALVVHTIQTALVILMGAVGWADLFTIKKTL